MVVDDIVDETEEITPLGEGHIVFSVHEAEGDHVTSFPLLFGAVALPNGVLQRA